MPPSKPWPAQAHPSASSHTTKESRSPGALWRPASPTPPSNDPAPCPASTTTPSGPVTCFFVDRRFRRQGLTCALLKAAVDYALSQKAAIVEGYPVAPGSPSYTYMGSPETFRRAGFCDVTPAGQDRRVMRFTIAAE